MKSKLSLFIVLAAALALAPVSAFAGGPPVVGAVYAMGNAPEGNLIFAYDRDIDGHLTFVDTYVTTGLGSGGNIDPLGSQGSLILSANQRWLIAVNAGSNDISVFRVLPRELVLVANVDSGGTFPTSLTLHHNLLYVLNAGQGDHSPNLTAFTLDRHGQLTPISESTRELGPGGFHQVGFNPRGDALVVTQGEPTGVNAIHVFGIDEDGRTDETPTTSPSVGVVPFGFIFDWRSHLLVTEAGSGAVSSYGLRPDKTLAVISGSVPNGNIATCWIAGTWFGSIFTANTGSDNLSGYKVRAANGQVRLREADAATGNKPIDMATTPSGRFLYVLNAGDGSIGAFRVQLDGSISDLGTLTGLPPVYAQGIAAR